MNKPLHLSTNPEILVKISPLGFELPGLESRPLKKERKNIDRIYSRSASLPSDSASLPSELNKCVLSFHIKRSEVEARLLCASLFQAAGPECGNALCDFLDCTLLYLGLHKLYPVSMKSY